MNNIHNFTNRLLCEYQSLFPTVASLLDHLLFTTGTGYDVDYKTGMIYDIKGIPIMDYPEIIDWQELIANCHEKEKGYMERFTTSYDLENLNRMAERNQRLLDDCAKYKPVSVDDSAFSEESIYNDLKKMQQLKYDEYGNDRHWVRPYPMSGGYSNIFDLNENTPGWFLMIGLNFCKAWVRFLNEEIATENVWTKPIPVPAEKLPDDIEEMLAEVLTMAGAKTSTEPYRALESDYADLTWTTRHRDVIVGRIHHLKSLLNLKYGNL
jgi:hypothetical protein